MYINPSQLVVGPAKQLLTNKDGPNADTSNSGFLVSDTSISLDYTRILGLEHVETRITLGNMTLPIAESQ